jgi:uncharacterized protein DUF3616
MRNAQRSNIAKWSAGQVAHADAQSTFYNGMCEPSAAVALSRTHFAVASDESNTLLIYERGSPDPIGNGVPLEEFLEADKSDIEAAAQIGDRVYWITSHSRNSKGELKKKRLRFFVTTIVEGTGTDGPSLEPVGMAVKTLRDSLIAEERLKPLELAKAGALPPKTEGAFDIEGLAATPDGSLLIGFRGPVRGGKALLVPITNPAGIVSGEDARIGDPILLDLDGRGVRSLEGLDDGGYLIVAGASGVEQNFAVYSWTGRPDDRPADTGAEWPPGFNLEALFAIPGKEAVQILSDDGKVKIEGTPCEDRPADRQRFRSFNLPLEGSG